MVPAIPKRSHGEFIHMNVLTAPAANDAKRLHMSSRTMRFIIEVDDDANSPSVGVDPGWDIVAECTLAYALR